MQKILIDTDPGQDIDDLLAIQFALQRPELDIKAITTVTLPSHKRARLVKRLLRYLNRTDIPVAAGMEFPLRQFSEAEVRSHHDFAQTMVAGPGVGGAGRHCGAVSSRGRPTADSALPGRARPVPDLGSGPGW